VFAVDGVAVEADARLDVVALPSRCSPLMPAPSSWPRASTPASTRRRCLAVLAVEAVAVEVDAPRRGGAALAVAAVAVELASRLDAAALPSPTRPWPSSWTPRRGGAALAVGAVGGVAVELDASTRRRWPAVLAVDTVAVEVDARLDVAALPLRCSPLLRPSRWTRLDVAALACGARRRCRGRRAGCPPRRGGAAFAVDAVAVELDARLDAAACSPSMPWPSRWTPRRGGAGLR
jgi:hypothetical protein